MSVNSESEGKGYYIEWDFGLTPVIALGGHEVPMGVAVERLNTLEADLGRLQRGEVFADAQVAVIEAAATTARERAEKAEAECDALREALEKADGDLREISAECLASSSHNLGTRVVKIAMRHVAQREEALSQSRTKGAR